MEKLHLYVAETDHPKESRADIVLKDEITQEELTQLNSAFRICSLYHNITQIKDIVIENGENFKSFMTPQNLKALRDHNISPEKSIMLANKSVLNYAPSIKTYIDMEKRLLTKHSTSDAVKMFEDMQHLFYDKYIEYRFWVNFRNYIVHCEFPYSIYQESIETGCKIICTKEHLLKFDNWKHSKKDIQEMEAQIDLPSLVDNMSGMIYAFYIDFFRHFANDITDGIKTYGEFCRKYDVRVPVIFKLKNREIVEGSHFQPLPVNELKATFDILASNPNVTINITN